MKTLIALAIVTMLAGCSTTAGALKGFGDDVKSGTDTVAQWLKPSPKISLDAGQ